jgi:hypothetical protein
MQLLLFVKQDTFAATNQLERQEIYLRYDWHLLPIWRENT